MTRRCKARQSRGFDAPARAAGESLPRFETPIVPQATISGRALVAVVAIMTFLASLTTGAVMLVRAAANEWQADVAREVTIQIRPVPGRDIEADVAKAAAIARASAGVAEVRPYSKEETSRLLEPWLGTGLQLDDLPVPRIDRGPDRARRGARSRAIAQDAGRADPGCQPRRPSRLRRSHARHGRRGLAGGIGVLVLVLAATVLSVTFATRAAMATNRPVIEVLHLIGAKDSFIAGHFQRHFLQLGLKGGLIGGGSAAGAVRARRTRRAAGSPARRGATSSPPCSAASRSGCWAMAVLAQVGLIAFVTAATSPLRSIAPSQRFIKQNRDARLALPPALPDFAL